VIAWLPAAAVVVTAVAFPRHSWRWLTGLPMRGRPGRPAYRTDATWNQRGTKLLHPIPVIPWHWWARRRRAAIRGGSTLAVLLAAEGLLTRRAVTTGVLAVLAVLAAAWGCRVAYDKVRNWRHNRDFTGPLDEALPVAVTVREVTRDRGRTVLALPPGFGADDREKKMIVQTVQAVLALPAAPEPTWKLHGKKPQVTLTKPEPPPGYVSFADIRAAADDAAEHEIILGLGRKRATGKVSVDNDSPHIGLSMGSGDGKSVTARNAASQLAHHGALIAVLDAKLMSQHWAAGLRNVAYARTPAELHALAIWLAGEVDRRNLIALYHADVEGVVHANPGPRIAAILEELNVTQAILARHWKDIGGKGRSPAVEALDHVSFTGRAVLVNLVYIGQRLSAKATSGGSGDARENLGLLLMSNPAASTWKMLVGDRHALPAATDVQGRLQVVTAKTVTEIQGAYVTGAQAREYATSGTVAVPRDDMPCVGGLAPVGTPERAAQDVPDMTAIEGNGPDLGSVRDSPGPVPLPPRITIREALDEGISGPTYDAVRKALSRALSPPQPVGRRGNADEYDRVEWCDWEELRRQPRRVLR
jgi:hypothetical protein